MYKLVKGNDEKGDFKLVLDDEKGDFKLVLDESKLVLPSSFSISDAKAAGRNNISCQAGAGGGRLASLDVFRGLTVLLMIFVDNVGGVLPAVNHSPWNGVTLADFVMPFFLFIVGVALPLAYKNVPCKKTATEKAIFRALKLLIVGLFLQGGFFHRVHDLSYGVDVSQMRLMGILQRIAIAYYLAAACEIWLKRYNTKVDSGTTLLKKYKFQWAVVSVLTAMYLILLYGIYVPDWEFETPAGDSLTPEKFLVKCGVRGNTGPACNAVGMIDRDVLGIDHLYRRPIYGRTKECSTNSPDYGPLPADAPSWCQAPFDPEGLLSSVMAIVTCLVGLHYGHIIIHFKEHKKRVILWLMPSFIMILTGVFLDSLGMHINKALYTLSYTLVTSGAAGILFSVIYIMVDVYSYRQPTIILERIGKHALMIFILVACNVIPLILQGFYWKNPKNNLLGLIGIRRK